MTSLPRPLAGQRRSLRRSADQPLAGAGREVWDAPENYHEGVTVGLHKLAEYTGDEKFTRQADLLSEDFGGR